MLRVRIFVLFAAIALMLPSGAAAAPSFFCKMMERVSSHCCCAARTEDAPRTAEVRGPDCCERMVMPARAGANATTDVTVDVPVAGLVAVLSPYELVRGPVSVLRTALRQARAPPGVGPPLFIVHCALLS